MTNDNTIFDSEPYLNPKYDFLNKYVDIMYKAFWTPAKYEKLIKEQDAPHYFNNMGEVDQECIKRCILAVSMVEDKVKTYWSTLVMDLPQTIIGDIGGVFGQSEVTHRRSYHSLNDALKIDAKEIESHPILNDRVKYLTKYLNGGGGVMTRKQRVLKKLILFTSLVERASLFTQFYILMSYSNKNRGLDTISALQRSTATEEDVHYSAGIDIINIIRKEHPELFTDELKEFIKRNIQRAYDVELKMIDWYFEKGTPSHITKKEVVNLLDYNFHIITKDLDLGIDFCYNEELFEEKNLWMVENTMSPVNPDFFHNAVGGYSSVEQEVDLETLSFG